MTPIAPLITSFLREHMPIEQGCSPHTCETYAHAFRLLFIFASKRLGIKPSQICLEQIDAALILDFLAHIEEQRGNCAATRNGRLAAVKAFIRYVEFRVPSALAQARQIHAIPGNAMTRRSCGISRWTKFAPSSTRQISQLASEFGTVRCCISASPAGCASRNWWDFRWRTSLSPTPEHSRSRQGPEGTMPSALEGNCCRPPRLAGGSRSGPCPRVVRECRRSCNDAGRFEYILDKHTRACAAGCPALVGRSVSPHQLRHYLPSRTMSSKCCHEGNYLNSKIVLVRNCRAARHNHRPFRNASK